MSIVIDKSKCIGCKRCRNVCPGSLIKTDENGKAFSVSGNQRHAENTVDKN